VGGLLSIFLEIGWQLLVSLAVQVSVFPVGFCYFDRPVANIFPVHLLQCTQEVIRFREWDKTVAFSFTCSSIPDDPCHLEGSISPENTSKDLIIDLISKISTKNAIVILGPIFHGFILPDFSGSFSQNFDRFVFLFLDLFALVTNDFIFLFFLALTCLLNLRFFFGHLFFGIFLLVFWLCYFAQVEIFVLEHVVKLLIEKFQLLVFWQFDCLFDWVIHLL